jgi:hypothetical protein
MISPLSNLIPVQKYTENTWNEVGQGDPGGSLSVPLSQIWQFCRRFMVCNATINIELRAKHPLGYYYDETGAPEKTHAVKKSRPLNLVPGADLSTAYGMYGAHILQEPIIIFMLIE